MEVILRKSFLEEIARGSLGVAIRAEEVSRIMPARIDFAKLTPDRSHLRTRTILHGG